MKTNKLTIILAMVCIMTFGISEVLSAQGRESKLSRQEKKALKELEKNIAYTMVDSLVSSRQFVFEPLFSTGQVGTFVLVDSIYGEVQNGMRNNLQGEITKYEISRNEKKKNITVEILIRGVMNTSTVVLFIGPYGEGTAKISGEFPEHFTMSGEIIPLDSASVFSSPDHFVR